MFLSYEQKTATSSVPILMFSDLTGRQHYRAKRERVKLRIFYLYSRSSHRIFEDLENLFLTKFLQNCLACEFYKRQLE